MGRPYSSGVKKTGRIEFRTTEEDERIIEECCSSLGKSKADIIRLGLNMVYKSLEK